MDFKNTLEFFLDDFSFEMGGNDMTAMVGDMDANVDIELAVAYTDTYIETADGRPLSFSRKLDDATITGEAAATGDGQENSQSFELISPLEEVEVLFTWDADEGAYIPTYGEDEEADEDLLDKLEARVDLAFMLPKDEVAEGDEWEIDPKQLASLLIPGGDLGYDTEEGGREEMEGSNEDMDEEAIEAMRSLMMGKVTGTYKGLNDDGLAEISVKLEIAGEQDFADLIANAVETAIENRGEIPEEMFPEFQSFEVSLSLDGQGTLLWDPRAGVVASFSMDAETEIEAGFEVSVPQGESQMLIGGEVVFGGSAGINLEAASH